MEQLVIMQASQFQAMLEEAAEKGAMKYAAIQSAAIKEDPDELLSVDQVAEKLKRSKKTILTRIHENKIPTAPFPKNKRMLAVQRKYLFEIALA